MPRVSRETAKQEIHEKNTQKPNVQFVGRDKDGQIDLSRALTSLEDGMRTILLPDAAEQATPFYHEEARLIRKSYPGLYKLPVEKGEGKE